MKSAIINSMIVMTTGDIIIQNFFIWKQKHQKPKSNKKDIKFDYERTLLVISFAGLFQGPTYCIWYTRILPKLAPMAQGVTKSV